MSFLANYRSFFVEDSSKQQQDGLIVIVLTAVFR